MALVNRQKTSTLPDYQVQGAKKYNFSPYTDNGGSIVALAGDDFAIIACDTRLTSGYSVLTRTQDKLFQLNDSTILGCAGCWCDVLTLTRVLSARMQMYKHEHHKSMMTPATAQMLSIILYHKRFFPYYISNILVGLDDNGKGCVYSYDPVGHTERSTHMAGGSAGALLQPLLDNQIGYKNQANVEKIPLTKEKAIQLIKDVFISAAERDINTGDSVLLKIVTKQGITVDSMPLRKD